MRMPSSHTSTFSEILRCFEFEVLHVRGDKATVQIAKFGGKIGGIRHQLELLLHDARFFHGVGSLHIQSRKRKYDHVGCHRTRSFQFATTTRMDINVIGLGRQNDWLDRVH